MVDVAWAVFNGKISGEIKFLIGSSKLTLPNHVTFFKFFKIAITSTKYPQKHLSRQKYMLMLSYNLKCIFPLGETNLKHHVEIKMRFVETAASGFSGGQQFLPELKFVLSSLIPMPFF